MFEALDRIAEQVVSTSLEQDDDGNYPPNAQELYEIATTLRKIATRADDQWLDSLAPHLKNLDTESSLNIPCASGDPMREN